MVGLTRQNLMVVPRVYRGSAEVWGGSKLVKTSVVAVFAAQKSAFAGEHAQACLFVL